MHRVFSIPHALALVLLVAMLPPGCRSNLPTVALFPTATPTAGVRATQTVVTATAPPTSVATPQPTSAPVVWTSAADGIQAALDEYTRAYEQHDAKLFSHAIDHDNITFRRFMQTSFDDYIQSSTTGQDHFNYYLLGMVERPYGFVQAQIESDDGYVADWLFREVDHHWVISEPTVDQIGGSTRVERGNMIFITYPWANAINPTLMRLAEEGRQQAIQRLGRTPSEKVMVHLIPICGLAPNEDPTVSGFYEEGNSPAVPDQIVLFTPQSTQFEFYDPQSGWEDTVRMIFTHEYTHLIHDRSFNDVAGFNSWMTEGLAEYIAENDRFDEVSDAVQHGTIIPLVDTSDTTDKQDLAHIDDLHDDQSLAYGLSYSVVAYIVEQHGGLNGFWKLARAYDQSEDLNTSLHEAFGISYKEFDHGWREWLKKRYAS